jgi:outer membrane protein
LAAFFNYGSAYNFQHDVPRQVVDPDTGELVNNTSYPRPFTEQFRTNNVFKSYGLQLTIPLFNGMQNRAAIAQQKVLYENSQLNRKNIEYQISSDVIRSVRNFEGAKKSLAVTSDQLKFADLAFRFETERYNLGITNLVDYINANRAFVQAQTDRAQAEYRLIFQKILIEYALGTLKPENLTD